MGNFDLNLGKTGIAAITFSIVTFKRSALFRVSAKQN